jgi:hypothetical protein
MMGAEATAGTSEHDPDVCGDTGSDEAGGNTMGRSNREVGVLHQCSYPASNRDEVEDGASENALKDSDYYSTVL